MMMVARAPRRMSGSRTRHSSGPLSHTIRPARPARGSLSLTSDGRGAYLHLMTAFGASPKLAALIRGWIAASTTPALQQIQQEMEQAVTPWMQEAVTEGERIGAIRTYLPSGLLIAVAGGMGQAMDTWLRTQVPVPAQLPALVSALIAMIRRAIEKDPSRGLHFVARCGSEAFGLGCSEPSARWIRRQRRGGRSRVVAPVGRGGFGFPDFRSGLAGSVMVKGVSRTRPSSTIGSIR